MSTLEQEIIEKFHQLDYDAQQRVRHILEQETPLADQPAEALTFDYEAWFRDMEALRQEIKDSHGGVMPSIDVVSILRDIREEN